MIKVRPNTHRKKKHTSQTHEKAQKNLCRYTSHLSHSIPAHYHTRHVLLLSRQHFYCVTYLFSSQLTVCLVIVPIINEFLRA